MSTLSVEISTTVSPSLTVSPTLTAHSRIVPSVTDSPPVGVTMSIALAGQSRRSAAASRPRWRRPPGSRCRPEGRPGRRAALAGRIADAGGRRRDRRSRRWRSRPAASDRDGVALGGVVLHHHAGDRGGDLGVDLVGGDLDDRLVERDGVALLLVPLEDGAFGDGIAHRRHDNLHRARASTAIGVNCTRAAWHGRVRGAPALGDDESDRPGERPETPEDRHRDGQPERDHAQPRSEDACSDIDDPDHPVGEPEDERRPAPGLPAANAHTSSAEVDRRVGEGRRPRAAESSAPGARGSRRGEHRRHRAAAARRPPAATARPSAGHQANSSCSASGVTSAPSASHAWPTSIATPLGQPDQRFDLEPRRAATDHSSSQLARHGLRRVLVELHRAAGAERPPPGPRREPRRPPASEPAAVAPSRTRHRTARLPTASSWLSRSAQRAGCSSSHSRSVVGLEFRQPRREPVVAR